MFLKLGRIGESGDSISLFVEIWYGSDTCYFKRFPIIVRQPSSKKNLCKHLKNTWMYVRRGKKDARPRKSAVKDFYKGGSKMKETLAKKERLITIIWLSMTITVFFYQLAQKINLCHITSTLNVLMVFELSNI